MKLDFYFIPRKKLQGNSVDKNLLLLFQTCYFSITLRMRCYPLGHLLGAVVTQTGTKQGCTLTTLLFNLIIQHPLLPFFPSCISRLSDSTSFTWRKYWIMSISQAGMRRSLRTLASSYSEEKLAIIIRKLNSWYLHKTIIKSIIGKLMGMQVCTYEYLRVLFQTILSWREHFLYLPNIA